MADIHYVCQGAVCKCKMGTTPDKLKVKSHQKEFINDAEGNEKLIATSKELGQTFENNSFGSCSNMRNKPCKVTVLEWTDCYEKVVLSNNGNPVLENSKATCPIGGPGCINIIFHGQTAQVNHANLAKSEDEFLAELNPFINMKEIEEPIQNLQLGIDK